MGASELLRQRDFRLVVAGQGLSWVGDTFHPIALSVAIVLGGGGARELGLILAAGVVARLAATLLGGVWADRLSPHRIMVAADLVRAATASATAVAFAVGDPSPALLAALAAVTAGAGAFFQPAFVSIRPLIVPLHLGQSANAVISFLQSSSHVAGPVVAGLVVAQAGPVPGFAVNAATFVWSALCVARVRARAARATATASVVSEIREGFSEIRSRDWLSAGLASAGMFHVATGVLIVLVEVTAVRDLGGAHALGLIMAAQGVGGVLGGLLALRVQPRRMLLWAFVALGAFPLYPLGFAWPGTLGAILAFALVAQLGLMYFDVGWGTALQEGIPHDRLARVASWDILLSFVALPIGNALAGPLSARFTTQSLMAAIAAWMLVAGCWPILVRGTRTLTRAVAAHPGVPLPDPHAPEVAAAPTLGS